MINMSSTRYFEGGTTLVHRPGIADLKRCYKPALRITDVLRTRANFN